MIQPRPSYFFPLTASHSFSSLLHSSLSFSIIFALCHRCVTYEHAYTHHTHAHWRTDADTSPQMGESREGWFLCRCSVFCRLCSKLVGQKVFLGFSDLHSSIPLSICGFCESWIWNRCVSTSKTILTRVRVSITVEWFLLWFGRFLSFCYWGSE